MRTSRRKAIGLSIALAVSLAIAGCSNSGNGASSNSNGNTAVEPEADTGAESAGGKYDPPITIHAALPADTQWKYPEGDDYRNNFWTRTYESKFGIKVEYDWTAKGGQQTGSDPYNSDYNTKLNVSIASGDIPDLFMVNAAQLKQLADAGQLADLKQVFEQHADPVVKEYLNGDGGLSLQSASFDGKLYAIPTISSTIYNTPMLWVRTDWLQKLNLPEPKSMQDVLAVAEAFAAKDPDGDG